MPTINVEKILKETDWNNYNLRVSWAMQRPRCHFYDGEYAKQTGIICLNWQGWLNDGRTLHPRGEKGLTNYIKDLKEEAPEGFLGIDYKKVESFLRQRRKTKQLRA